MGRNSHTPLSAGKDYVLSKGQVVARGFVTDEKKQRFTVRQGARAPKTWTDSTPSHHRRRKDKLRQEGILVDRGSHLNYLELIQDHEFEKPSQAASLFLGRNDSGQQQWKEDTEARLEDNLSQRHAQQVADGDDAPLRQFEEETRTWPQKTEADQLVRRRRGQKILRKHLMKHWRCCCLTGIRDPDLLRASHIRPWAECESNADRLDPNNCLLLSALWDAALDRGLVTFDDKGYPQFSPHLSQEDQSKVVLGWQGQPIPLTPKHQKNLAWHRQRVFRRQ